MIVIDTGIMIAFSDAANPLHKDAKRVLLSTGSLAITALSGAELVVHLAAAQRPLLRGAMDVLAIEVIPITEDDMSAIADIRRESGLKMPDAVVLWCAISRLAGLATFDQTLRDKAAELGVPVVGQE